MHSLLAQVARAKPLPVGFEVVNTGHVHTEPPGKESPVDLCTTEAVLFHPAEATFGNAVEMVITVGRTLHCLDLHRTHFTISYYGLFVANRNYGCCKDNPP